MQTFLIVAVVVILLGFGLVQFVKNRLISAFCRLGAVKIYRDLRGVFGGVHEIGQAERSEFEELDCAAYDAVRKVAEARGFQFLGGIENLTVSRVHPDNRTLIELYTNGSGTVGLATYQVQEQQFTDVISETEDGRFFLTTNAELDKLTAPPQVSKKVFALGTPVATLISAHEEELAEQTKRESGLRLLSCRRLEDGIESARRFSQLASEYRRSIGYLTEAELTAMVTDDAQDKSARVLWKEFRKIAEQGRAEAA